MSASKSGIMSLVLWRFCAGGESLRFTLAGMGESASGRGLLPLCAANRVAPIRHLLLALDDFPNCTATHLAREDIAKECREIVVRGLQRRSG